MALDNSQESINPYVEVYIIDQNKSGFAVDPQVIISLDEYYNMDLTLENLLPKQFTGIITSIEKDDKIIAMKLLLGIYNELDNETKQLVDLYFCRYAEDSQDREVINAFQKITSAKDKHIIAQQLLLGRRTIIILDRLISRIVMELVEIVQILCLKLCIMGELECLITGIVIN